MAYNYDLFLSYHFSCRLVHQQFILLPNTHRFIHSQKDAVWFRPVMFSLLLFYFKYMLNNGIFELIIPFWMG